MSCSKLMCRPSAAPVDILASTSGTRSARKATYHPFAWLRLNSLHTALPAWTAQQSFAIVLGQCTRPLHKPPDVMACMASYCRQPVSNASLLILLCNLDLLCTGSFRPPSVVQCLSGNHIKCVNAFRAHVGYVPIDCSLLMVDGLKTCLADSHVALQRHLTVFGYSLMAVAYSWCCITNQSVRSLAATGLRCNG